MTKRRAHFYTPFGVVRWVRYLPLPLGEVAEHSEDGEGKPIGKRPAASQGNDRDFRGVCEQIDIAMQKRPQDPLSHLR